VSDDLTIPSPAYRVPRRSRPAMDPGTKRLLIIAGGLGGVLVATIAGSALIGRQGGGEVPVVQADNRPIRVKPENPGGLQVAGAGNEMYSGGDSMGAKPGPAAEVPDPKGLRAPPPASAPVPAVALVPPLSATPAAKSEAVAAVAKPAASITASSAAKPAPPPMVTVQPAAKPVPVPIVTAQPQAKPAPAPVIAAPAAPAPAAQHAAAGKATLVQLSAVSTETAARSEWQNLTKRMPELLNGRQPVFSKTERDGRVFWRVRTAGFSDVGDAKTFCDRVRAKGGGCTIAEF